MVLITHTYIFKHMSIVDNEEYDIWAKTSKVISFYDSGQNEVIADTLCLKFLISNT